MASEILRAPKTNVALPSSMQALAAGIATAASLQGKESIDHAIQTFTSIPGSTGELLSLVNETTVQAAGHVADPLKYFTLQHAAKDLNHNGTISMSGVFSHLRKQNLHFHQGVASFLKSGIQESLASLKINGNPSLSRPSIPVPLDEVISTEKLKNPDRTQLQVSLQVMNEMFSTLKSLENAISDLRLNRLSSIRA